MPAQTALFGRLGEVCLLLISESVFSSSVKRWRKMLPWNVLDMHGAEKMAPKTPTVNTLEDPGQAVNANCVNTDILALEGASLKRGKVWVWERGGVLTVE